MAALDHERISLVFAARPDILGGIQQAADTPERIILFNSIASFITETLHSTISSAIEEPSAKRRRGDIIAGPSTGSVLENGALADSAAAGHGMIPPPIPLPLVPTAVPVAGTPPDSLLIDMANAAAKEVVLLEVKEISVSIPQRKKYDLCFTKNYLYTKQIGTTMPVQGMVYNWSQIEYVFYAPIPEKAQLQHNYILFPHNTVMSSTKSLPPSDFEPLVFTVPQSAPKPGVVGGYAAQTAAQVSDSYTSLFHWAINSQLQSVGNETQIVGTDPRVFHSVVRQAHRPNERAVHVKAFRGSKDGYLFFLPNGILWGFKKPLLFLPLDRIVAISYTSVLQRTFNMVVELDVSPTQGQNSSNPSQWVDNAMKTEEIEFAMIDQEDYAGIDETYVRRHGLQDRTMSARRKAKRELRENMKKGAGDAGVEGVDANGHAVIGPDGVVIGDDMTALEQAEQQLEEDEEDEEEEDYDPGSEGESEGEGESSEDDDDDEAEGYDEDGGEEEGYVEDHE